MGGGVQSCVVNIIAGSGVMVGAAVSTCVFSVVVSLSSLYVDLCSIAMVCGSASSMCCGGLFAVFIVGIAWFVEYRDGG